MVGRTQPAPRGARQRLALGKFRFNCSRLPFLRARRYGSDILPHSTKAISTLLESAPGPIIYSERQRTVSWRIWDVYIFLTHRPGYAILPKLFRSKHGVWLSLVERSVRDAEVAGSNPVTPITSSNPSSLVHPHFIVRRIDRNPGTHCPEARVLLTSILAQIASLRPAPVSQRPASPVAARLQLCAAPPYSSASWVYRRSWQRARSLALQRSPRPRLPSCDMPRVYCAWLYLRALRRQACSGATAPGFCGAESAGDWPVRPSS